MSPSNPLIINAIGTFLPSAPPSVGVVTDQAATHVGMWTGIVALLLAVALGILGPPGVWGKFFQKRSNDSASAADDTDGYSLGPYPTPTSPILPPAPANSTASLAPPSTTTITINKIEAALARQSAQFLQVIADLRDDMAEQKKQIAEMRNEHYKVESPPMVGRERGRVEWEYCFEFRDD